MSVIRKSYTVEFKTKVVREILREEKTLSHIASEYGTHTNVISRWRDQALAALPGVFNDQAASDQAAKEAKEQTRTVDFSVLVAYQIPTGCGRSSSD